MSDLLDFQVWRAHVEAAADAMTYRAADIFDAADSYARANEHLFDLDSDRDSDIAVRVRQVGTDTISTIAITAEVEVTYHTMLLELPLTAKETP